MQRHPALFIAPSPLGQRGVFAAAPIPKDSLLEICPVIVLPGKDLPHLDKTGLFDYYFIWGEQDQDCALVLGYGSLYNHSYAPNGQYQPDFANDTLDFFALRDIEAGEEIMVNYSGNPEGARKLWFEVKK